jgi:hypothetical protein
MIIFLAVMMVVLLGIGALVLDMGRIQHERARMQATVDSMALGGAEQLPDEDEARAVALELAQQNGYVEGEEGLTEIHLQSNPDGDHGGRFLARLTKRTRPALAGVLGVGENRIVVEALATFTAAAPISITGGGTYGMGGIQNPAIFGPFAYFSYGDAYSTRYLDNGAENPRYREEGYDFAIFVPSDYQSRHGTSTLKVELFDPETWNVGNAQDAGPGKCDEIRSAPGGGHPQPGNRYTTTQFTLYAPDNTLIATAVYGPNDGIPDSSTDQKWVCPNGFLVNLTAYGLGNYRLNVKALDGSSENGFNLRAGPPSATFNPDNGTNITATGRLPTNFSVSGVIEIDLGYLPADAAEGKLFITKFDTDVGARSITYHDDLGHTWPGRLSSNGTFVTDVIDVPENYVGSVIYARYQAGAQDTSVWEMFYEAQKDRPGELLLID